MKNPTSWRNKRETKNAVINILILVCIRKKVVREKRNVKSKTKKKIIGETDTLPMVPPFNGSIKNTKNKSAANDNTETKR